MEGSGSRRPKNIRTDPDLEHWLLVIYFGVAGSGPNHAGGPWNGGCSYSALNTIQAKTFTFY